MTDRIARDLLRLLTAGEPLPEDLCADWADSDWAALEAMLAQHRLAPWLHWQLTHAQAGVRVPEARTARLHAAFRDASLRSLALQRELLQIQRALAAADIECIALKGAFLARHVYPHPAVRTMRDLDILVPPALAMRAFDVLLACGFERLPRYPGDPQAFLDGGKHMPPIRSAGGRVLVEIHARLAAPAELGQAGADAVDEAGVWARRILVEENGAQVAYMAPTDLLLHLIVHAAYDHRFDNGPLVLADLHFLMQCQPIDWPLFWRLAERGRWARGACLLLEMVATAFGRPLPAGALRAEDAPVAQQLAAHAQTAMLLSLRDVGARVDQEFIASVDDAAGWCRKAQVLLAKAFPSRHRIAAQFPVRVDSPLLPLWYVARWAYLGRRALQLAGNRRVLAAAHRLEQGAQRRRIDDLDRFLERPVR